MRAAAVRIAGWRRRLAWARLCAAEARRREEERQRRALQVIWKVVVPWLARRALRFKKRRLAVLRGMIRVKGYARRQATRQDHWWDLAGERALDIAGESYRAAKEAARLATAMAQHAVTVCVEIKILRRVRAESSRRPPRHRCDACSMAWRCRFLTARPSQDRRVIAEK